MLYIGCLAKSWLNEIYFTTQITKKYCTAMCHLSVVAKCPFAKFKFIKPNVFPITKEN